jgi:RHS repeat-associated protein
LVAARVDSGGAAYFGKDVLGSVRTVTGEYGQLEERYEYDAFGKPYQGEFDQGLNLGYTGKPYDTATGLYDYGYRDYAPEAARFTTADPVRDGTNWFVYVNNDPVNYIDLWGLSANEITSYNWPLQSGTLTSAFGYYDYYKSDGTYVNKFHGAIDIGGNPAGTPVSAIADGTVTFSGNAGNGYGNTIEIEHSNGISSKYSHLHELPTLVTGDFVSQGQTVGLVGNTTSTGSSTGVHLDLEIRVNNEGVDPLTILDEMPANVIPRIEQGYVQSDGNGGYVNWLLNP